jgi:large subunit ribosomal protein L25
MKSITLKDQKEKGKVATKALRNAGLFLAYYTEEIRQFISQQKLWLSKNLVYTPNAHTVVIDLGNGKSLTIYKTFKFTLCLTKFYILTLSNL